MDPTAPLPRPLAPVALALAAALAAALGLAACSTPRAVDEEQFTRDERLVVKFSHVVAEDTPKGRAARHFANLVTTRSGGRIEVQVFPNSQLYADGEELVAVRRGDVHIIAPTTSKLSELVPGWQVFDLPYAFPSEAEVVKAMEGPIGAELADQLRRYNLVAVALWDNGYKHMTSARQPLIRPADLAGQRFRVMPNSRILVEQFRVLGAQAVPLPFHEVYSALASGQVDGQENTASNIASKQFDTVQRYLTVSQHGYLGYAVLVNADFWAGLPESARDLLSEAMAETTRWVRANAYLMNAESLTQLQKGGRVAVHFQTPDERREWQQALLPVYDRFRTEIGGSLLDAVLELRRAE